MADINELTDINRFFYYGSNDLKTEIQHDLAVGLLQEERGTYYFRDFGVGVDAYENNPNSLELQVDLKFRIANFVAKRNNRVTDGSNGQPDRRIATSQNVIRIEPGNSKGELDITVYYIPYSFIDSPESLTVRRGE